MPFISSFSHSFRAGRRPAFGPQFSTLASITSSGMGGNPFLSSNSGSSTPGLSYHTVTEFYASDESGAWAWDEWDHPSNSNAYSGLSFALPNGTQMPGYHDKGVSIGAFLVVQDIDLKVNTFTYPRVTGDTIWRIQSSNLTHTNPNSDYHISFAMVGQYAPSNQIDFSDFGNHGTTEAFPSTITEVEFTIKDTSNDATDYNGWMNNTGRRFRITRGARNTGEDLLRRNSGSVTGSIDHWGIIVTALTPNWSVELTNTTYTNVSFSVNSQETLPLGMAFNTDGTKMFIIGRASQAVHQYNLSTGFDLSTASYSNVSFNVANEANWPNDVSFSTDGTKMYVLDTQHPDDIFQYNLSTAFDISTASYNSVSFDLSTTAPGAIASAFSRDGTKMFVIDGNNDSILQYSLTTGFDLSTASYDNVSLAVTSQDTIPYGLFFNPEGTRMYVVGTNGDQILQYDLGTGYDLSTASYSSNSVSVVNQDTTPRAVAFSADGAKMFMLGSSNNTIYQYNT